LDWKLYDVRRNCPGTGPVVVLTFAVVVLAFPAVVLAFPAVVLAFPAVVLAFAVVVLTFAVVVLTFAVVVLTGPVGFEPLVPEREPRRVTESARMARRITTTIARSSVVALVRLRIGWGPGGTDNGGQAAGLGI
jgi:fatty acid desaturase